MLLIVGCVWTTDAQRCHGRAQAMHSMLKHSSPSIPSAIVQDQEQSVPWECYITLQLHERLHDAPSTCSEDLRQRTVEVMDRDFGYKGHAIRSTLTVIDALDARSVWKACPGLWPCLHSSQHFLSFCRCHMCKVVRPSKLYLFADGSAMVMPRGPAGTLHDLVSRYTANGRKMPQLVAMYYTAEVGLVLQPYQVSAQAAIDGTRR